MDARSVIEAILPSSIERRVVLRQLLDSSGLADSIAPEAWAVTLKPGGFRLNVGQVEVLTFWGDVLRLLVAAGPEKAKLQNADLYNIRYNSIQIPHLVYEGSVSEFQSVMDALAPLHAEFIRAAATTSEGRPRQGSPHKRFHSPELIEFAKRQVSGTQRYFALLWNPTSDKTQEGLMESLFTRERTTCQWTCGRRSDIAPGDYVFLRRTVKNRGIIGYGTVISSSMQDTTPFVRVDWSVISPNAFIKDDDPGFADVKGLWTSQSGGTLIDKADGERLLSFIEETASSQLRNNQKTYQEGKSRSVVQTKYEADPAAREACLRHYGYKFDCEICEFNFSEEYGSELGAEYIHVHHIVPRSLGERDTNPETDLIPVCANCHAMLHQTDPPLEPAELKKLIGKDGGNQRSGS